MHDLGAFIEGKGVEACRELSEARNKALAAGLDVWRHAVQVASLVNRGISHEALSFLVTKGYAEVRVETTPRRARVRTFAAQPTVRIAGDRCCIVLTASGQDFWNQTQEKLGPQDQPPRRGPRSKPPGGSKRRPAAGKKPGGKRPRPRAIGAPSKVSTAGSNPGKRLRGRATGLPEWNEKQGNLTWRGRRALHLAPQASAERAILRRLQTLRWPPTMANPLTGPNAVHRRRNAVRQLNAHQNPVVIVFYSRKNGRIGWFPAK